MIRPLNTVLRLSNFIRLTNFRYLPRLKQDKRLRARLPLIALTMTAALVGASSGSPAMAANLYVDGAGACAGNSPCFTTIQAAINAAAAGDTINVYAGTYAE